MKKLKIFMTTFAALALVACGSNPSKEANNSEEAVNSQEALVSEEAPSSSSEAAPSSSQTPVEPLMTIDYETARAGYQSVAFELSGTEKIDGVSTPITDGYTVSNGVYTITKAGTWSAKGYLKGQIIISVNGVELELNQAFLENNQGKAPIYCTVAPVTEGTQTKAEVKGKNGSSSYVVQYGGSYDKDQPDTAGAIVSATDLDLGGKGALAIIGSLKHGVKAQKVVLKSEGARYVQGSKDGSAINCNEITNKDDSRNYLYCINSKNGIKADTSINLIAGDVSVYDCETGFKTEKKSGNEFITLSEKVKLYYDEAHITTLFDTNAGKLTNNATVNPPEE